MGHANQWVTSHGCQTKERDRCQTRKVSEDEQRHALGYRGVGVWGHRILAMAATTYWMIHVPVAQADAKEGQSIDDE